MPKTKPSKPKGKREHWNINDWRGHNYMQHFEKRAYIQAHPQRDEYTRACASLPCPTLNEWGVGIYDREQEQFIFSINRLAKLDVWFLNPWYCTEKGWSNFQEQWQDLPEVIHSQYVDIFEPIHIIHRKKEKARK